ncbi:MAG: LPS translocon maturation chaperone LptM [Gammaproteobacteria bacterium]
MKKWILAFCMICCLVSCGQTGSLYLPHHLKKAEAKK